MEADNSKIVSELHGKQLCCEMQKSGKWGQNYFINLQAEISQNTCELSMWCDLKTASIVKMCPVHLWKNI